MIDFHTLQLYPHPPRFKNKIELDQLTFFCFFNWQANSFLGVLNYSMENFTRWTSKAHYLINNLIRWNYELDLQQIALYMLYTHAHSSTFLVSFRFDLIRFGSFHFAWYDDLVTNENRINWQWPQTQIKTWTIKTKTERRKNSTNRSLSRAHTCEHSSLCVILFLDWPYIDGIGLFRFNDETNMLLLLLLCCRCFFYSIYELSVAIHSPDYFSQN